MRAFSNYHPFVLFFYFLSVIVTAMFVWNPVIQISALLGAIIFSLLLSNKRENLSNVLFYVPLFLLISLTNPLFSHNGVTPLFFLNGNPVTLEAVLYGVGISVMVIGVMLWCKCYGIIMTSDKFLYLFGRIIPKLSLVLSMILRFVPNFKRQMKKVSRAQKAMGLYTSKSYVDKMRGAMRVFSVMITWSLENSMETANSMKARGYGLKGRSSYSLFKFTKRDGVLLFLSAFFITVTLIGVALGKTDFYYYPEISKINMSTFSLISYISFLAISILPFIIDVKENIKWKYYISKI